MIRTEWRDRSPRPVAVVLLDRAARKNALTPAMLDDLAAALAGAGARAAAVVLGGAGDAFCSGFDLSICKDDPEALGRLLSGLSGAIRLMRGLPVPVVVAAHGAAIAGGCALLGGADVVVTHAECKLGYPVVRLGISPGVSAPFFAAAVGHGRARERMLGGGMFSGTEAVGWGLAHVLVPTPERVLDEACAVAESLAAKPPGAMAATKAWLNELDGADAEADGALAVSMSLVGSAEERERLAALWA
jgi:enoyl-CoA hydratase/carnithine racemase